MICIATVFCFQCAVEAPPLGGKRDTTPPQIVQNKSTKNLQTNFTKQPIALAFNEWVLLKNPAAILVSPPLEYPIKSVLRGKKLLITFDDKEVLEEQATYTINLSDAIVDYTEGNKLENEVFIFSTGSKIDSCSAFGKVIDDYSRQPVKDVLVTLYKEDSADLVTSERPFYYTKTDEQGNFKFQYLAEGTYYIFALQDKNANYYKDLDGESFGFLNTSIQVKDSLSGPFVIPFSTPTPPLLLFSSTQIEPNSTRFVFNRKPDNLTLKPAQTLNYQSIWNKDTLFCVWDQPITDSIQCIVEALEFLDTITLAPVRQGTITKQNINVNNRQSLKKSISVWDSINIPFTAFITDWDPTKISVRDSSSQLIPVKIARKNNNPYSLSIFGEWAQQSTIQTEILPGGVQYFNHSNKDTINLSYTIKPKDQFGEIIIKLDSLNTTKQYLVYLKQKQQTRSFIINNKPNYTFAVPGLNPGNYTVRVVVDNNKNGRWDPSNYLKKTPAEPWVEENVNKLMADWTLEVIFKNYE